MIEFYDRRNDANNTRYHEYFAYVNSDGTAIHGNVLVNTFASNPIHHTTTTGRSQFIGETSTAVRSAPSR